MRMFAALPPPPEVVADLADFLEPRRSAGEDLRWTDPGQWHITLAFMASVPDRAVDDVAEAVAEAALDHPTVRLRLAGAGTFPHPAAARVLWTGVDADLAALARRVRGACSRAGGAPEGGRFVAHVTVARFRRPVEATRWVRVLEGYAGPAWTAGEVTLLASHLGEGRGRRPRYEVLSTAALNGASLADER
jgi:2'-5' RNA ligase